MAQAREIKKRIRSVESTQKITRTMELVSTSKMKKAQDRVLASRPYASKLREIMATVSALGTSDLDHPLLRAPESPKKIAVFLITSNRGLCGAYNTNVIRLGMNYINEHREQGSDVDVYLSGKKAISYFNFRKLETAKTYIEPSNEPRYEHAEEIGSAFIDGFANGRYDRVVLIYTRFMSAGRLKPTIDTLLPFTSEGDENEAEAGAKKGDPLFEPSPEEIVQSLLPLMVKTRFYEVLLNAQASEHGARMVAMKMATDNAGDLKRTLNRFYNKERQAQITQELAEIMGGVEALKA